MAPPPVVFIEEEYRKNLHNISVNSIGERLVFLKHLSYDIFSIASVVLALIVGKVISQNGIPIKPHIIYLISIIIFLLWTVAWIAATNNTIKYEDIIKSTIEKSISPCHHKETLHFLKITLIDNLKSVGIRDKYKYFILILEWSSLIMDGMALEIIHTKEQNPTYPLVFILMSIIMWGITIARRFLIYEELIRINNLETILVKQCNKNQTEYTNTTL